MQSHKCAYLDDCGDQCRADEYCTYKLKPVVEWAESTIICGKDQMQATWNKEGA